MIALDSSALLAIVLEEAEGLDFTHALARHDCVIGAPTLLEAQLAAAARAGERAPAVVRRILSKPNIEVVDFTSEHAAIAFDAFERFGRDRHPAKLNFGDCMAYAVATAANAPLLFKGGDFALTDIAAVDFSQGSK
jgi:ribonuclease VapC